MANHVSLDKITTKAATEEFKDGWERIFGNKQQDEEPMIDGYPLYSGLPKPRDRVYCRTCGIDRTDGAMCEGCSNAVARSLNRKRQIMQAGGDA